MQPFAKKIKYEYISLNLYRVCGLRIGAGTRKRSKIWKTETPCSYTEDSTKMSVLPKFETKI